MNKGLSFSRVLVVIQALVALCGDRIGWCKVPLYVHSLFFFVSLSSFFDVEFFGSSVRIGLALGTAKIILLDALGISVLIVKWQGVTVVTVAAYHLVVLLLQRVPLHVWLIFTATFQRNGEPTGEAENDSQAYVLLILMVFVIHRYHGLSLQMNFPNYTGKNKNRDAPKSWWPGTLLRTRTGRRLLPESWSLWNVFGLRRFGMMPECLIPQRSNKTRQLKADLSCFSVQEDQIIQSSTWFGSRHVRMVSS